MSESDARSRNGGARVLGVALLALLGAGCASYRSARFAPAVQETELRGEADDLQARIVVAWRGIEEREGVPELRFRFRIENPGPTAFALVPAEIELLDAGLSSFGAMRTDDLPVVIEPGQAATFDTAFRVPDGTHLDDYDLAALNLRARFQAGRWSWSTTFQRVEGAHDPGWDAPVHFQFGVGWWIH